MIKFNDEIFEDYFIDATTGIITDKDGVVQNTVVHVDGREYFMNMPVHRIQMHTNSPDEYHRELVVHHIDENPLNNVLSNLQYLDRPQHAGHHLTGKHYLHSKESRQRQSNRMKGRHLSEEHKNKLSLALKGKKKQSSHILSDDARKQLIKRCKENKYAKGHTWKKSEESKKLMHDKMLGRVFWNNGIINKLQKECPGEGWFKGRLIKK